MIGIGERRPLVGVFVAGGGALFGAHVGQEKEQRRKGGGRHGDHWYARGRGSSRAAESRAATARLGGSARGQDRRRRAPRRRRGELGPRRPPAGAGAVERRDQRDLRLGGRGLAAAAAHLPRFRTTTTASVAARNQEQGLLSLPWPAAARMRIRPWRAVALMHV